MDLLFPSNVVSPFITARITIWFSTHTTPELVSRCEPVEFIRTQSPTPISPLPDHILCTHAPLPNPACPLPGWHTHAPILCTRQPYPPHARPPAHPLPDHILHTHTLKVLPNPHVPLPDWHILHTHTPLLYHPLHTSSCQIISSTPARPLPDHILHTHTPLLNYPPHTRPPAGPYSPHPVFISAFRLGQRFGPKSFALLTWSRGAL